MEEARVARPEQRADDGVLLVARARDRVVAAVRLLEFAGRDIDRSTRDLVFEETDRGARGQRGPGGSRVFGRERRLGRRCIAEVVVETLLDYLDARQRSSSSCPWRSSLVKL